MTTQIKGSVALVTGANRGLGAAFCRALLDRGAATVYAGARDLSSVTMDGVVPVQLDVTNSQHIAEVVRRCGDIDLLVNNAGITGGPLLADDALADADKVFATNVFGPLALSNAFAPVLGGNGGGTVVNVLSVLAWYSMPGGGIYSASKAAGWALTNSLRLDLQRQGTNVIGLYVGLMDTDMTAGLDLPKSSPADVASQTLDAVERGAHEVLADESSRTVRAALSSDLSALYPSLV